MIIDLAIPETIENTAYTQIEIAKPKGSVLANTPDIISNKGVWHGILEFLKGCTVQLLNESRECKRTNESILTGMRWNNLKGILIKIMAWIHNDYCVKGIYTCPMCAKDIIVKPDNYNSVKYIDLPIEKGEDKIFEFALGEKIEVKNKETGELIFDVSSISLRMATLADLILVGNKNLAESKRNYAILAQTITAINGNAIDNKFRNMWGAYIFENLCYDDLEKISAVRKNGGIKNTLTVGCNSCGESFEIEIDTDDFFLSGLQKKNR